MNDSLKELIALAQRVPMNDEQQQQQRLSFAYGSAKIENDLITREMIEAASKKLETVTQANVRKTQ